MMIYWNRIYQCRFTTQDTLVIRDRTIIHLAHVISSSCSTQQKGFKFRPPLSPTSTSLVGMWGGGGFSWYIPLISMLSVLSLGIFDVFYLLLSDRKELKNKCWRLEDAFTHPQPFAFRKGLMSSLLCSDNGMSLRSLEGALCNLTQKDPSQGVLCI